MKTVGRFLAAYYLRMDWLASVANARINGHAPQLGGL